MEFIKFESIRDKEAVRQDLRDARNELLRKAEIDAKKRAERDVDKELRGEKKWILPSISKKLKNSKSSKKKKKKDKKLKSSKKSKKKSKKYSSSESSDSTDSESEEERIKSKKKRKKSKKDKSSSSDTTTSESDEWIEKANESEIQSKTKRDNDATLVRDDWMTNGELFMKTYAKERKEIKKKSIDEYDPATSSRELNPHWKNNGDGLPSFQKPSDDIKSTDKLNKYSSNPFRTGGWKKQEYQTTKNYKYQTAADINYQIPKDSKYHTDSFKDRVVEETSITPSNSEESDIDEKEDDIDPDFLTDQQMNELAAKIIKAEIMNNDEQIRSLKQKLEKARQIRTKIKETCKTDEFRAKTSKHRHENAEDEHVLLTVTDKEGNVRPFQGSSKDIEEQGYRGKHKKNVETHVSGKRVRYFPDDERYDINQMFTRERNIKGIDSDLQFAEIAGKSKNPNDDLEDIFADSIRKNPKDEAKKQQQLAIQEQERIQRILDDCDKCFNTPKMQQNLMVSMGSSVYLSLPWYEGLQPGHCLIIPMQHQTCSTRLDEDVWAEITEYRKALTRLFEKRKQDVIFFEIARYLNRSPHMVIHCIPCKGEMAPFYFKKAIQESEQEWSTNKQLIYLKDKDLRRSIPKGLPYLWVNFGMSSGFAHVIEDQNRFPENYAQEIIGNMLELDPRSWRKPRKEHNFIQKVKQFADWFKPYDFTNKR